MSQKIKILLVCLLAGANISVFAVTKPAKKSAIDSVAFVCKVATRITKSNSGHDHTEAYAGDVIRVSIVHPQQFLENKPQDKSKLLLFVDGIPFAGISSTYFDKYSKDDIKNRVYHLPDTVTVPFILLRDSAAKPTWEYLYRSSGWLDNKISVDVSVGWDGMFPLGSKPVNGNHINIIYYHDTIVYIFVGFYLIFVVLFMYTAVKTDILRDPPVAPATRGAYSLAQTQLAFWTVIIIGGFVYTLVLTDISGSLNTSVLLLLGISITTNGLASGIDYYKKKTVPAIAVKAPGSFIANILSDGNTYSVQRVQTAVWNLAMGIYFIYYTIDNKAMPVFPDVLLTLAGVSSLAYVAGKGTEPT